MTYAWIITLITYYVVGVWSYLYSFGLGRYKLTLKEIKTGLVIGGLIGTPVTFICGIQQLFRRKLV